MDILLGKFFDTFWTKAAIMSILYVLVFISIMADVASGIHKSIRQKAFISSYGLRKIVSKVARYYNMLLAVSVADMMQMVMVFYSHYNNVLLFVPILPFLTFIGAFLICFTEIKSIFEKTEDKDKAKAAEAISLFREALQDTDTLKMVQNILKERKDETEIS